MKAVFGFLGTLGLMAFLAWAGVRIYYKIQFGQNCEDYISQAASSPDPGVAAAKLDTAIAYAERAGLTSGNTGVLFTYPTNDVGFWYRRMVDSRAIIRALPPNDAPLEISNTMMRVHETLVAGGKEGQRIVEPDGIEIAPHNAVFALWGWLSFLLMSVFYGIVLFLIAND